MVTGDLSGPPEEFFSKALRLQQNTHIGRQAALPDIAWQCCSQFHLTDNTLWGRR